MKYALVQTHDVEEYNWKYIHPIPWQIIDIKPTIEELQSQIDEKEDPSHYIIIQLFNE
jgi:hypothetical protein